MIRWKNSNLKNIKLKFTLTIIIMLLFVNCAQESSNNPHDEMQLFMSTSNYSANISSVTELYGTYSSQCGNYNATTNKGNWGYSSSGGSPSNAGGVTANSSTSFPQIKLYPTDVKSGTSCSLTLVGFRDNSGVTYSTTSPYLSIPNAANTNIIKFTGGTNTIYVIGYYTAASVVTLYLKYADSPAQLSVNNGNNVIGSIAVSSPTINSGQGVMDYNSIVDVTYNAGSLPGGFLHDSNNYVYAYQTGAMLSYITGYFKFTFQNIPTANDRIFVFPKDDNAGLSNFANSAFWSDLNWNNFKATLASATPNYGYLYEFYLYETNTADSYQQSSTLLSGHKQSSFYSIPGFQGYKLSNDSNYMSDSCADVGYGSSCFSGTASSGTPTSTYLAPNEKDFYYPLVRFIHGYRSPGSYPSGCNSSSPCYSMDNTGYGDWNGGIGIPGNYFLAASNVPTTGLTYYIIFAHDIVTPTPANSAAVAPVAPSFTIVTVNIYP